jgi:CRISPR/Cas system-associated protein Csx1
MKKTLLIAPIGDPTRYKEARYKLKDGQINGCVSFLAHHADYVIIVGLSSIVDLEMKKANA